MNNETHRSHNQGFTLLELAIVIAIVSVLGAGSLAVYSEFHDHAKWQESQAKLQVIKKAILKFTEKNNFVPCPDANQNGYESRTNVSGRIPAVPATPAIQAVPGTETRPTIPAIPAVPAQPAIPNIPVSTCTTHTGTVPYETLGLSRASVEDSWGNLIVYAVDQGVTSADLMLECPTDTSCFFNRDPIPSLPANRVFPGSALPAFNDSTLPTETQLGTNNLRICADTGCSETIANGQVVILVAKNQNGQLSVGLDADEAENIDLDRNFVVRPYSKSPFYDDALLGISAYELKKYTETETYETVNNINTNANVTLKSGENILGSGADKSIGNIGDNNPYSQNVQTAVASQTISFGAENAGKTVVMQVDTKAYGTWDQPSRRNPGLTSDQAFIAANGEILETLTYDSRLSDQDGYYDYYDPALGGEPGVPNRREKYWDDAHEVVFTLDENGDANLEFAVATTGTDEQVDFTNIQLILYGTPPLIPDFPSVQPIDGISQTQGLE
ncbi:MAG: prepilin-type N-terminal cleavage/methylation domain-containing protein [Thiotrichales bacterium]|nr:prepilin-type N-terminal cleavage/methylation domain-containing protein [Thiotrichales bacterium]